MYPHKILLWKNYPLPLSTTLLLLKIMIILPTVAFFNLIERLLFSSDLISHPLGYEAVLFFIVMFVLVMMLVI